MFLPLKHTLEVKIHHKICFYLKKTHLSQLYNLKPFKSPQNLNLSYTSIYSSTDNLKLNCVLQSERMCFAGCEDQWSCTLVLNISSCMLERCGYCSIHELIQESTLLKKQVILSVTKTVGAFSLIWGSVSTCADIFQDKSVFCVN